MFALVLVWVGWGMDSHDFDVISLLPRENLVRDIFVPSSICEASFALSNGIALFTSTVPAHFGKDKD